MFRNCVHAMHCPAFPGGTWQATASRGFVSNPPCGGPEPCAEGNLPSAPGPAPRQGAAAKIVVALLSRRPVPPVQAGGHLLPYTHQWLMTNRPGVEATNTAVDEPCDTSSAALTTLADQGPNVDRLQRFLCRGVHRSARRKRELY